jgi:hypothetical protein
MIIAVISIGAIVAIVLLFWLGRIQFRQVRSATLM